MKHKKENANNKSEKKTKKKEDKNMAVLAKPSNKIVIISADKSKKFVKDFNNNNPSKKFLDSCKTAGELFKRGK